MSLVTNYSLGDDWLIPSIRRLHGIHQDPISAYTYFTAYKWIIDCIRNHPPCELDKTRSFPKRLVDVGEGEFPQAKLVLSTAEHQYLCFSHCWGPRIPFRTEIFNTAALKTVIPWEKLPRSFQDAIMVTRWLGERYIWIDALCIVQDDKEDWDEESSKMGSIFGGCKVVIAATRASSCTEGFSQSRRIGRDTKLCWYKGDCVEYFAEDPSVHYTSLGAARYPFPDTPLFHRGWCFQEQILAPRTLNFTERELIFECRMGIRCECGGMDSVSTSRRHCHSFYWKDYNTSKHIMMRDDKQPESKVDVDPPADLAESMVVLDPALELLKRLYWSQIAERDSNKAAIQFGQLWGDLTSDYTACQLTFDDDILVALSGIARKMAVYNPGRYLAGLWERDLHYLLAWSSDLAMTQCRRPARYTAPSFSWASVIGPVSFRWGQHMISACSVLYIKCIARTQDNYSQFQCGYIVLRGKMIRGRIVTGLVTNETGTRYCTFVHSRLEPTNTMEFDTEEDLQAIGNKDVYVYCFDLYRVVELDEVGEINNDFDLGITALVLQPINKPNCFKRVGYVGLGIPHLFDVEPDTTITIY